MRAKEPQTVTFAASETTEDRPRKVAFDQVDATFQSVSVDRYARKRVLGKGGMGTVVLVRDNTIGREVALKELTADESPEESRQRFAREARLQGQLEHPAIVPVYDVGASALGKAFFTMKRVRGQSLAEVLEQRRSGRETGFSLRKLLSAFSQLCAAAHYAHERGVVHRDIKPTNVMLGDYGEVYLLDWGVAKVAGEAPAAPALARSEPDIDATAGVHTGRGSIMGTLTTMAPEQAVGGEVGPRTDIYALGAVLFEILTGQPFHPTGDFDEVIRRITVGIETRPSVRVPEAGVPPELEELCVRATKLQPADRLASAKELRDAIESYLDGDRDLELRRVGAQKHTAAAAAAANEALRLRDENQNDEDLRATALSEVGRALALDPDNHEALGVLVKLLTTPPKAMPREIQQEHEDSIRTNLRRGGLAAAIVYGYISVNAITTWKLGVVDVKMFAAAHFLWGLAFLVSVVTIFRPSHVGIMSAFVIGIVNSAFITSVYGPYILPAMFISMHAVLFALVKDWRPRIFMIGLCCIAWTVSVFGQYWGIFPETTRFIDGNMVLHSDVVRLPPTLTPLYLYAAVLATIIAPAIVVGALRTAYHRAEVAMRLQSWQLRRLVSDGRSRQPEGQSKNKKS